LLVTGLSVNKLYMYDPYINSYTQLSLTLSVYDKVLCKKNNRAYLLDSIGAIYESDLNNPYKYTIMRRNGRLNSLNDHLGHQAFYKDSMYFFIKQKLYKFDFNNKGIQSTEFQGNILL